MAKDKFILSKIDNLEKELGELTDFINQEANKSTDWPKKNDKVFLLNVDGYINELFFHHHRRSLIDSIEMGNLFSSKEGAIVARDIRKYNYKKRRLLRGGCTTNWYQSPKTETWHEITTDIYGSIYFDGKRIRLERE